MRGIVLLATLTTACSSSTTVPDAGQDAGTTPRDAAADAGALDAGAPIDGGHDAGHDGDAGMRDAGFDGGTCLDPAPGPDRSVAVACSPCRPRGPDPGPSSRGDCESHSDCTEGANGRCVFGQIGAFCSYDECFSDTDCTSGEVCSCDGSYFGGGNVCVAGDCRVNSDCASGRCAPSYGCLLGGPPNGWYCRTPDDTCTVDSDCTTGGPGGRCSFDSASGHWSCDYGICIP